MHRPSRTIRGAGIAGSLSVILMFILTQVGVEVPADVASAASVLIATVVGYLVPEPE